MALLSKGTLALVLALAASGQFYHGTGTVSATEIDIIDIVREEEAAQPVDLEFSGATSLLVSFADETAHEVLVDLAKKKGIKEKGRTSFAKQHKIKAATKSKGQESIDSEGTKIKNGDKGKGKGKRRNLIEEDAMTSGFSVLELGGGDVDVEAEMAELMAIDGVTAVEEDGLMHIESIEYQQKLRGGGVEGHVREIQDAIKAAMAQFPEDEVEVEFSPNFEGEDAVMFHPERRLAEATPYGINMVNVSHLWTKTPKMTTPIKICVVDTGYDLGHPDLPTNVTGWHKVNSDGSKPFGEWDVDGHGHGTHCAGTIGAIGGNDIGVVGVNPDSSRFNFIIGKGLSNSGSGSSSNVMEAVLQCVNAGAKVVSMSLGSTGSSSTEQAFYEDQYDKDGELMYTAYVLPHGTC